MLYESFKTSSTLTPYYSIKHRKYDHWVTQVGIAFGKIRSAGEASTRREMLDGGWLALANVGVSASSVCYLLRWLV